MNVVKTPQTRCRAAVARSDITPPVGIYHRMWGAATHERATGVHRPLSATLLWLEPAGGEDALVLVSLDHCLFDTPDIALFQEAVGQAAGLRREQVHIAATHTHAAGLLSRSRAALPGGELIGPYLDGVANKLAALAAQAAGSRQPATIVYGTGRCALAAHRDYFDAERGQFVCGYNPGGTADDTLLVARITAESGTPLATFVNYACHPTTLAWQNTQISPDYVGALRETVEQATEAPCVFLQGASGDLGPREGFVGDPGVADRNGRQVGYAALAALESLPEAGTRFVYAGPVVSGATIGTWRHEPATSAERAGHAAWQVVSWNCELAYRADLPTLAAAQAELAACQAREAEEASRGQADAARHWHARVEQAQRQFWRLQSLPQPRFPLPITLARLGDAVWILVPGEHYQLLQTSLRKRFAPRPLVVATLTDGWQPGYFPPAATYGRGIYQEQIAVVAQGSAEQVLGEIEARVAKLLE